MNNKSGFTLVELLVVIAVLTILFVIVLLAINPSRIFAQANNVRYKSDVNAIYNAITQYWAENDSRLPSAIPVDTKPRAISTAGANICADLMSNYIPQLPTDPVLGILPVSTCVGMYDTNYKVVADKSGNYIVYADSVVPAIAKGQIPGGSPVLEYKFEELSGQALNSSGSYGDSVTASGSRIMGKYGSSYKFDATNSQYIEIPATPNIALNGTGGETIMMWVRHGPSQNYIMHQRDNRSRRLHSQGFNFKDSSGVLRPLPFDNLSIAEDNKWHHVAFVYDPTVRQVYSFVDGVKQAYINTLPVGVSLWPASQNWWLGRSCLGSGTDATDCVYYHTGEIDDFKIFNHTRTQAQINLDALIFER